MTENTQVSDELVEHSFYAVMNETGKYFAGFNPTAQNADFVENILDSKLFTNKYEIKLRPQEKLCEVTILLSLKTIKISEPFRPRFRPKQEH